MCRQVQKITQFSTSTTVRTGPAIDANGAQNGIARGNVIEILWDRLTSNASLSQRRSKR